jgi:DNA (cytosine-5)-methyltransferase 1
MVRELTSLELCAGGGGQALGLETAGFSHVALVELNGHACETLRLNRPHWNVVEGDERDLRYFNGKPYQGVDLVAGGVPCPPFSKAGKQLGRGDERNLFPEAIRVVRESQPKAVMLENVRGLLDAVFEDYRKYISTQLRDLGYVPFWHLVNAADFGVPQLRPRVIFVALRPDVARHFVLPIPSATKPPTVGETLYPLMASRGWKGATAWKKQADEIAPTIVGGSHKHGGPDLGPTRAKRAWAALGVDAHVLADEPPGPDFVGPPRLTVPMVALLQGFPSEWKFSGRKTPAYRQVGNAFPPPVAAAMAEAIHAAIDVASSRKRFSVG